MIATTVFVDLKALQTLIMGSNLHFLDILLNKKRKITTFAHDF